MPLSMPITFTLKKIVLKTKIPSRRCPLEEKLRKLRCVGTRAAAVLPVVVYCRAAGAFAGAGAAGGGAAAAAAAAAGAGLLSWSERPFRL